MRLYRLSLGQVVTEEKLFSYYRRIILGRLGETIMFPEWLNCINAKEVC